MPVGLVVGGGIAHYNAEKNKLIKMSLHHARDYNLQIWK